MKSSKLTPRYLAYSLVLIGLSLNSPLFNPPAFAGDELVDRCLPRYLFDYKEHMAPHWFERNFQLKTNPHVEFKIRGFLDNGVLYIDLRARALGNKRLEGFTGTAVFDEMMQHFGKDQVRSIAGEWHAHSDNLLQFNQFLLAGLDEDSAAQATWTGQQAARYGFTRARITLKQGNEKPFTLVKVLFERP